MRTAKNGYTVEINNNVITMETPEGESVKGFVCEGSYGAKNKSHYIAFKVADKRIVLKEIIANYLNN